MAIKRQQRAKKLDSVIRNGKSHYRYEDRWCEENINEAILTDTSFAADISTAGDSVTIKAFSTDNGEIYEGTYHYRNRTEVPGRVQFSRYRGKHGDLLSGFWFADNGTHDLWFIVLND